MKYQNLSYTPGLVPLYSFNLLTDSGIPQSTTGYTFRFEVYDDQGNMIYLNAVPSLVLASSVNFTIEETTPTTAFSEGNYAYRLVGVSSTNQVTIFYKGFVTVNPPVELPSYNFGTLTSSNISDFSPAVQALMTPYVSQQISTATTGITMIPANLPTDGVTDATPAIKVMHDYLVSIGGGTIRLPAGLFVIGDLQWHPSVGLKCAGRTATILRLKPNATQGGIIVLARANTSHTSASTISTYNPEFSDFWFDLNAANQTATVPGIWFINPTLDAGSNVATYSGTDVFGSGRIINVVIDGGISNGVRQDPGRNRGYFENTRVTNCQQDNVLISGSDTLIGPRCYFGGSIGFGLSAIGASNFLVFGAYLAGNSLTRSTTSLALNLQDCTSAVISNNVIQDTIKLVATTAETMRSGITISGNVLKPDASVLSTDGVVVNADDNTNCHIWVQGYDHVVARGNVFDPSNSPIGTPKRFKYLAVVKNSGGLEVDATISSNTNSQPWALAGYEPFLTDGTSKISYAMVDVKRGIKRTNGTVAFGLDSATDAGTTKSLVAKNAQFLNPTEFQATNLFSFPNGSRAVTMADGGVYTVTSTAMIYLMQSGVALNSYSITLPSGVSDGHVIEFHFQNAITNLTVSAPTGTTIASGSIAVYMPVNGYLRFIYQAGNATWNLLNTLPGAATGAVAQNYPLTAVTTTSPIKVTAGTEISAVITTGFATVDISIDTDANVQANTAKWTTNAMTWMASSVVPTKVYHNCWIRFNCTSGSVQFTVDPNGTSTRSVSPLTVLQDGTTIPRAINGSFNVLVTGASIDARNYCSYSGQSYSRTSGVVTVTFGGNPPPLLPGNMIRVASNKHPEIEGQFAISTYNTSTQTATWADNRSNITAGTIAGSAIDLHDMQAYAFSQAWVQHMIMGLGGRVQPYIIATGGTNVQDWFDNTRLANIAANGPYGAIIISGGGIGNAILGQGRSGTQVFDDIVAMIQMLVQVTGCDRVYLFTPPPNRNITPNDSTNQAGDPVGRFTTGTILYRKMYRDIVARLPFVKVVSVGEALIGPYGTTTTTDMQNGWPDANYMNTDGTHYSYPALRLVGMTASHEIGRDMQAFAPETHQYADNRSVNTVADPTGNYNPNLAVGLWGTVATSTTATTAVTGTYPTSLNPTLTWLNRGSAKVQNMVVQPNLEGGSDWVITVQDITGGNPGPKLTVDLQPTWLLNAMNDTTVQNKYIDIFFPMYITSPNEFSLVSITVGLYATIGGIEYHIASALSNDGFYSMISQGRAMNCGFGGVLRFPRFKMPAQGVVASASLRLTAQHIDNTVAPYYTGQYQITICGNHRFEVVI